MNELQALIAKEDEDEDFDLLEAVLECSSTNGWPSVVRDAMAILEDTRSKNRWRQAANVLYWAASRTRDWPCPPMKAVAQLYECLIEHPGFGGVGIDDAENLVWSVAKELKGIDYLSDWQPLDDPEVRQYLPETIRMTA